MFARQKKLPALKRVLRDLGIEKRAVRPQTAAQQIMLLKLHGAAFEARRKH